MEEEEGKKCCGCNCDNDGICCKCQYYCPIPPLLIDTVYHRFREPFLSIICMLIIIAFGSSNIYGLSPLTCDEMYIVDPTCSQTPYKLKLIGIIHNYTETKLISQNNVFYNVAQDPLNKGDSNNGESTGGKYHTASFIDTASTFILLIGNSPYHSPIWLGFGFMGSMYSTYIWSTSIEYCHGDYCKTTNNDRLHIPNNCNIYINQSLPLCDKNSNTYSKCTDCLCLEAGYNSCMNYMDKGVFDRLHILMSYFWFILIYLRQIITFILIIRIIYIKKLLCGKNNKENESYHALHSELIKDLSMDQSIGGVVAEEYENKQDLTAGLIQIKKANDNELSINSVGTKIKSAFHPISSRWKSDIWYIKMYKIFSNPLSVRLTAASCICIIMLIVLCDIFENESYDVLSLFFHGYPGATDFIMSLLWIDGIICVIIYLRTIWMLHHQFRSDVIALYIHYNNINDADAIVIQNELNNNNNNNNSGNNGNGNKILLKLKLLITKLFPINVLSGTNIVKHVQKCGIMNAYLFIFMYPISVMSGFVFLFIAMAIPILILASIIFIFLKFTSDFIWSLIWWVFGKLITMLWPIIFMQIFNICILRKETTDKILKKRHVRCFWYIIFVDVASTISSALFVTLYNIFVIRLLFSFATIIYGLLHPYKSLYPSPFETSDKIYYSYCSNVALTALSLLKSMKQINQNNNK